MTPQLSLYLHTDCDWFCEKDCEALLPHLQSILPDLLCYPKGVDHVLSQLEEVELNLVDDDTIARVHGDFLQDPTATDVITFHHGEIFVSVDTAARYAEEHGISPREELMRYLIHGLVHLHGYLDETAEERDELFAVQEPLVLKLLAL